MTQLFSVPRSNPCALLSSPGRGWRRARRIMERPQSAELRYSLSNVALFAGLRGDTLERINRRCSWRQYEPGEPIVTYLDTSDDVFFLTFGEAGVTIYSVFGKAVSFRNLGPGEMFGEYAAIDGEPRCASVEARTKCLIASMPGVVFRNLIQTEPAVALALFKGLVGNIRNLTRRVYEFSTLAVNNRIQAELLRLASFAPREGNCVRIDPAPTHSEIASRVSTSREAVSRELNRLSHLGILERGHGALLIRDLDRIAKMLHEMTGE